MSRVTETFPSSLAVRVRKRALAGSVGSIRANSSPATQFTTLAHELAHLFLGHLGPDKKLNVPKRRVLDHASQELEAESVAYITCSRNGVTSKSETYLSAFVTGETSVDSLDLYQIMRAAGQVEAVLGLGARTRCGH
jgi:antirestriction protein ArdC